MTKTDFSAVRLPPEPDRRSIGAKFSWKAIVFFFAFVNIVAAVIAQNMTNLAWGRWLPGWASGERPSLATQLRNIVSDAASDGYQPVGSVKLVQFRVDGERSRVLLLRPISADDHLSDELRIYDVVGSGTKAHFKLALAFRPQPRTVSPAPSSQASAVVRAFAIRLRLISDLDGQPGDEIVADVSEYAVKPIWPRPVFIAWVPATRGFAVRALLSPATTNRATMNDVITRDFLRSTDVYTRTVIDAVYNRPSLITDAANHANSFTAYAVEAYVLKRESLHDPRGTTAGGLALTAGYIVRSSGYGTADLLQAVTWHINMRHDPPVAQAATTHPTIIRVGANWSRLPSLLVRARS